MTWNERVPGEPTAADLAAIEAQWPLIEAELAVLDAQIVALSAVGGPGALVCRRTAAPVLPFVPVTSELAESFKGELKKAAQRGERFDETTGLPDSMLRKDRDITWYEHAQEYAAVRWKVNIR